MKYLDLKNFCEKNNVEYFEEVENGCKVITMQNPLKASGNQKYHRYVYKSFILDYSENPDMMFDCRYSTANTKVYKHIADAEIKLERKIRMSL